MSNRDIVEYIKASLGKNLTPKEIYQKLTQVGWKDKDILAAFAEVGVSPSEQASNSDSSVIGELHEIKRILEDQNRRLAKLEGRPDVAPVFNEEKVKPMPDQELNEKFKVYKDFVDSHPKEEAQESVETKVTGKWFAVIGIIAILFGVAFFLKYAFENNLIGETGRVIMGVIAGVVLLLLGDFLSKKEKYRQYSFFISGGGLGLLYLSIYGAFNFYHLIGQVPAFIFMILVTLGGMIMSIKENSEKLAGLAILGGFLTPFLVSTGQDNQFALFSYVLILNLGFLFLSYFRKWRVVYFLNFAGTFVIFFSWMSQFYNESKLSPTLIFLSLFFLVFLIAPFLRSLFSAQKSDEKDLVLSIFNASIYFGTSYSLLIDKYEPFLGFFFALGALIYLICAYAISSSNKEDRFGIYALGGIGLVLITLAIPIQLSSNWITIAWAVESLLLAWIGFQLKSYYIRVFSSLVLIVTAIRLIFYDIKIFDSLANYQIIFNERFITYLIAIIVMFSIAYLYSKHKDELKEEEKQVPVAIGVAANLFSILILSLESHSFFEKKIINLSAAGNSQGLLGSGGGDNASAIKSLKNFENLTLSFILAIYSAILMVVGIVQHIRYARLLAITGFGAVIFKVFLYDIQALSDLYRIVSFIALGIILLVVSFLFYRYKDKIKEFLLKE